jgi:hypothetical protein
MVLRGTGKPAFKSSIPLTKRRRMRTFPYCQLKLVRSVPHAASSRLGVDAGPSHFTPHFHGLPCWPGLN